MISKNDTGHLSSYALREEDSRPGSLSNPENTLELLLMRQKSTAVHTDASARPIPWSQAHRQIHSLKMHFTSKDTKAIFRTLQKCRTVCLNRLGAPFSLSFYLVSYESNCSILYYSCSVNSLGLSQGEKQQQDNTAKTQGRMQ